MLHGPLAEIDGVVCVVRGPAVGGPVVPGLEPHVRNQVKVKSDLYIQYFFWQCPLYKCQLKIKHVYHYYAISVLGGISDKFSGSHLFLVERETNLFQSLLKVILILHCLVFPRLKWRCF